MRLGSPPQGKPLDEAVRQLTTRERTLSDFHRDTSVSALCHSRRANSGPLSPPALSSAHARRSLNPDRRRRRLRVFLAYGPPANASGLITGSLEISKLFGARR